MSLQRAEWKPIRQERGLWVWLRETPAYHWVNFVLVLGFVLAIEYFNWLKGERYWILGFVLRIATVCFFGYSLSHMSRLTRPSRRLAQRLRFVLSGAREAVFPVKMTVLQDGEPIGQDEGTVTLANGMLAYEGLQTAFALKPEDVVFHDEDFSERYDSELPRLWKWLGKKGDPGAWGFRLLEDEQFRVFFFPLKARGFSSVYAPLYRWMKEKPEAVGETVLPPIEPLPGFVPPSFGNEKRSKPLGSRR